MKKRRYNTYYILNDMVVGITNNTGREFYFDLDMYETVCKYTWNEESNGYISAQQNFGNRSKQKKIKLHKLIMNNDNNMNNDNKLVIDHINQNKRDNRKSNLRYATYSQNQMNKYETKSNTSGTKGVYWHKNKNKWQANIQINGKLLYLGIFNTKEEAIKARKSAEQKYFKEYNPIYN